MNSDILRTFMAFITPWQQFWRMSRQDGFWFALMTLLYKWVPESLFHARGFVIVTVEAHQSLTRQAEGVSVRRATPDDLALLSHCGYPQSILGEWFERGADAWLIERESQLFA